MPQHPGWIGDNIEMVYEITDLREYSKLKNPRAGLAP